MHIKRNILILLSILLFTGVLAVNALAVMLPLNDKSTGELSDAIPNLFVPAGVTFSIWGVIYLLLLCFVIYQAIPLFKKGDEALPFLLKTRILFIFSCLLNISWIFAWHYEQILLSWLLMLAFLLVLIFLYLTIRQGRRQHTFSWQTNLCLTIPFSIYLGWITVATIANTTALLVTLQWGGWGISEAAWTVIIISIAAVIGLGNIFTQRDLAYSLVLVWAFAGIIIKRTDVAFTPQPGIVLTASLAIAALVLGAAVMLFLKLRKQP